MCNTSDMVFLWNSILNGKRGICSLYWDTTYSATHAAFLGGGSTEFWWAAQEMPCFSSGSQKSPRFSQSEFLSWKNPDKHTLIYRCTVGDESFWNHLQTDRKSNAESKGTGQKALSEIGSPEDQQWHHISILFSPGQSSTGSVWEPRVRKPSSKLTTSPFPSRAKIKPSVFSFQLRRISNDSVPVCFWMAYWFQLF